MSSAETGFRKLLVATDFSPYAEVALQQALRLAEKTSCEITLAHVISDVRGAILSAPYAARKELAAGDIEQFARSLRQQSDARLVQAVAAAPVDAHRIHRETLLGAPYIALVHAVQREGHDLVILGSRGQSAVKRLIVGSTALRLVRKCPATVWISKTTVDRPVKSILAAVDFSDVSGRALDQAAWLAAVMGAELHALHSINEDYVESSEGEAITGSRRTVRRAASEHFEAYLGSRSYPVSVTPHLAVDPPAKALLSLAKKLSVELIAMGTVGRSGVAGVLLGNTAEKVLSGGEFGVLAVKPKDFVSPIQPPVWPLHPDEA